MKTFKDVADEERFVVHGGYELIRVCEGGPHNCVDAEDSSIGIKLDDSEPVFSSIDELKALYPNLIEPTDI